MTEALRLIRRIEVPSGGQAIIQFNNIPQSYSDLYLLLSFRSNSSISRDTVSINPNGNTSNRSHKRLIGYDNSVTAGVSDPNIFTYIGDTLTTSNTFTNSSIYISNYTSSNAKFFGIDDVQENNSTSLFTLQIQAAVWNDSSPITSLELDVGSGNFVQYSSATLYGIKGGSDGTTVVS